MDALSERTSRLISAADLASIPDFKLGQATVSPSRRTLSGPGGAANLQPRVMQVFVLLAENAGRVVSRETLFERCWGGVYVGDDSLNRVVAAVRKICADVAAGGFEIETIPKTGYRLTGAIPEVANPSGDWLIGGLTRRQLTSAAAGIVALGGIGGWAVFKSREERRFEQLLRDGDHALAGEENLFRPDRALRAWEAAVRIHPDNPRAVGRLALAQSYFALEGNPGTSDALVTSAVQNAKKALALNPVEPNALLAMFELQGSTRDWWSRDRLLRKVIAADPQNGGAMSELASLLQATGLCRESWNWNERILILAPLSKFCLGSRALKLWIFGKLPDADNVVNQLRAQFPSSNWIWSLRFLLYALTRRAPAAQAMLQNDPAMLRAGPETFMWRSCLDALAWNAPDTIAKARAASLSAARVSGDLAGQGMMVLCALNDVDSAFEIANAYFLSRGAVFRQSQRSYGREPADALHRINTKWLFMPPCKNMRNDQRFLPLCEGIGLVEYWRRRGLQPDYMRLDR